MAKLDYSAATGTEVVYTIDPGATESGNTYNTFASYQTSEATSLITAGEKHLLQCRGDIGRISLSGSWSMDANHFIKIEADTGQTYTITPDASSNCIVMDSSANDERLFIEDAQIDGEGQSICIEVAGFNAIANLTLVRCKIYDSAQNAIKKVQGGDLYLENCEIYDHANNGVEVRAGTTDANFCTLFNINSGANSFANGFWRSTGGTFTTTDCASDINTTGGSAAWGGTFDAASDYNAGVDTTAPGSNSVDNITDAAWVDTVTPYDLTPEGGEALDGAGVAISGITDDIDGNTRGSPPSIGCREPAGGGGVMADIFRGTVFGGLVVS